MGYPPKTKEEVRALLNASEGEKRVGRWPISSGRARTTPSTGQALFDRYGRRIPLPGIREAVVDADRCLAHLRRPSLTRPACAERLAQLFYQLHFSHSPVFLLLADLPGYTRPKFTVEIFGARVSAILEKIEAVPPIADILRGVYFPIFVPPIYLFDYGVTMETVFLPTVERSLRAQFPDRTINHERHGKLAGAVEMMEGTRHEDLVKAMKEEEGVVAVYFPIALQGYSCQAAREQMYSLPEGLTLAGGLDTSAAMIMWPDFLARDDRVPVLDMSALRYESAAYALAFGPDFADDSKWVFGNRNPGAYGTTSSGLLAIG